VGQKPDNGRAFEPGYVQLGYFGTGRSGCLIMFSDLLIRAHRCEDLVLRVRGRSGWHWWLQDYELVQEWHLIVGWRTIGRWLVKTRTLIHSLIQCAPRSPRAPAGR
jgi:hypothetical protein